MDEFCRLRRNEEYGACPDEVHKCAFGILRLLVASFFTVFFSNSAASGRRDSAKRNALTSSPGSAARVGKTLSRIAPCSIKRRVLARRSHVALAIQQNLLLIFQLTNFLHDLFLLVFFLIRFCGATLVHTLPPLEILTIRVL